MEEKYIEYEEAIKKFLLDIDCLDNISILIILELKNFINLEREILSVEEKLQKKF